MRFLIVVALLCGTAYAERLRKGDETKEVPEESVEFAIKDGWQRIPTVLYRDNHGNVVRLYEDMTDRADRDGWWRMTPSEASAYEDKRVEKLAQDVADKARAEIRAEERKSYYLLAGVAAAIVLLMLFISRANRRERLKRESR